MKITKTQLKKIIKEELGYMGEKAMLEDFHNTSLANSRVKATLKDVMGTGPKYLVTIEIKDPDGEFDDAEDLRIALGEELLIPHLVDVLGNADYLV